MTPRGAALPAMLAAAVLCVFAGATPASAAERSHVVEGQHLRLVSTADPEAMRGMLPGSVAIWDVSISADAPEPGVIDIALGGSGELPLEVDVRGCAEAWTADGCPAGAMSIERGLTASLDGTRTPLLETPADATTHLRLEVAVPSDATPPEDATTVLRVHAEGYGDQVEASPPGGGEGELPRTGMQLGGSALLAAGAVIVGVAGARLFAGRRSAMETS
ncbi:hypothetical protein [Agrococcus baldri]|uniref:LPXTG-motif cell wall anchor domain-containing protein n=1 Tax=Agrococcus baldri TaxID=153730 RepID=A0AA87UQX9_9MICO|nr:hypothetical protein [Agrococcus baldri]GEK79501.1 hypothetical protein ABA31_08520 [Agrococcus baldri]